MTREVREPKLSKVDSGSVVVTAYDFESGRPHSNPECDRRLPPRTSSMSIRNHSDGYLSDITPAQVFLTYLPP